MKKNRKDAPVPGTEQAADALKQSEAAEKQETDVKGKKSRKKKQKSGGGNAVTAILLILFLVMGVCTYNITGKLLDYRYSSSIYDDFAESYAVVNTEKTPAPVKEDKEESYTWDFPDDDIVYDAIPDDGTFPVEINFEELKEQNSDVVGWLYLDGTKINYPVVKGVDNDQYLHTLINGHYSFGGTLFLDASCKRDWTSRNNIIYGHNMNDGSMFRPLIKYKEQEYADENPYLYLSTPDGNYRLDIFAGVITESEAEVFSTVFPSTESFTAWYQKMMEKSVIHTDVVPTENSRIVSMSTCTYEKPDMRFVVMALMRPII